MRPKFLRQYIFLVHHPIWLPGYQIGCMEMPEFLSLVLRNVYQVPQAACSFWELTLRKTPRSQSRSQNL